MAPAICSRIARTGMSTPDNSVNTSNRRIASRAELACTVVIQPRWPVFIACNISRASGPRHSPTTKRSGRIRSALISRSRSVTDPSPSMFGGRVSRRTVCGKPKDNSAASSSVITRSSGLISRASAFNRVVFPAPVPPHTNRFKDPVTASIST